MSFCRYWSRRRHAWDGNAELFDFAIQRNAITSASEGSSLQLDAMGFVERMHDVMFGLLRFGGSQTVFGLQFGNWSRQREVAEPVERSGAGSWQWISVAGVSTLVRAVAGDAGVRDLHILCQCSGAIWPPLFVKSLSTAIPWPRQGMQ